MLQVAGLIPEGTITRVLESTDIVDLVGRYFPLKRAGQGFVALCPFHNEKTPSFHVSPQRQTYHCFGCGKGGHAIGFLMEMEKVPFPEAVGILAERCGVRLERNAGGSSDKRKSLLKALKWAAGVFERNLASTAGEKAREYLRQRGISDESIKNFCLGYSAADWDDLIRKARAVDGSIETLEAAGLVIGREGGGHYDRFRDRLMFPIADAQGRIVGFGARALDPDESAKYINSPETALFSKGKLLYGLAQARDTIFRSEKAVVVEGYTDVIMAHQHGITNVVATLGTALGREHIRRLKRYAKRCTLVFDGDIAGQRASDSSLQTFVEEGSEVSVATLPEGKDPCDCLVELGPEAFSECLDGAFDIFEFKLRAAEADGPIDPKRAAAIVDDVLDLVARVPNAVEQRLTLDGLVKLLSRRLSVTEESVRRRFVQTRSKTAGRNRAGRGTDLEEAGAAEETDLPPDERELIAVCLHDVELFPRLAEQVHTDDLTHAGLQAIFQAAEGLLDEDGQVQPAKLSARVTQPGHASLLAELLGSPGGGNNYEDRLGTCIEAFQRRKAEQHVESVRQQMLTAAREGDVQNSGRLSQEYARLKQQHLGA